MKHKSKPYTKKFPIHYDAAVEGMEPGKEETARLVFGCVPKEAEDNNCGVCIYWRHRMITSFDTLSVMTQKDFGIIGIAATGSILNPTNNKQGFVSNTDTYEAVEQWIKECFHDYKQQNTGEEVHGKIQPKTEDLDEESAWAECESCGKWRRLPPGVAAPLDDESWYCWNLPKGHPEADCAVAEEKQTREEVRDPRPRQVDGSETAGSWLTAAVAG
mmetsp:Transcript_8608/g.22089  ORF Transcript_8608/g.22089 Transcript_8608/m.22089 type:complete len:216 (-) Transcript_8608:638-1285(-)